MIEPTYKDIVKVCELLDKADRDFAEKLKRHSQHKKKDCRYWGLYCEECLKRVAKEELKNF